MASSRNGGPPLRRRRVHRCAARSAGARSRCWWSARSCSSSTASTCTSSARSLPAVARGLGGKPVDMTAVFTWQQIGMAVGAFTMPPLADRIGRRPVLAICLLRVRRAVARRRLSSTTLTAADRAARVSGHFPRRSLPDRAGAAVGDDAAAACARRSWPSRWCSCRAATSPAAAWPRGCSTFTAGRSASGWPASCRSLALPLMLLVPESLAFRVSRDPRRSAHRADRSAGSIRRSCFTGCERFHLRPGSATTGRTSGPSAILSRRYRLQTVILWCDLLPLARQHRAAVELAADLFPGARRRADPAVRQVPDDRLHRRRHRHAVDGLVHGAGEPLLADLRVLPARRGGDRRARLAAVRHRRCSSAR